MLNHGGNLQKAQQLYPNAETPWLDLSTGISPWVWPVPNMGEVHWQRLPEVSESFNTAVEAYYGVGHLIPTAGSQEAIEIIPALLPAAKVAVPAWGYGEHAKSWQRAGHQLIRYSSHQDLIELLPSVEHVVVINPNNPTGDYWSHACLTELLAKVSGTLVVDEAFIDSLSQPSLLTNRDSESLIVLRSVGKFFGLAGIRLGFVSLPNGLREGFKQKQLLWGVSAPALHVAEKALSDKTWQGEQKTRINTMRAAMLALVKKHLPNQHVVAGPLFVSVKAEVRLLKTIHQHFAEQGVWLRIFAPDNEGLSYLRFGLPQTIARCEQAFSTLQLEQTA